MKLPEGKRVNRYKWVLTVKHIADGSTGYEGGMVSRGFTQTSELDFHETFELVAKLNSIRDLVKIGTKILSLLIC